MKHWICRVAFGIFSSHCGKYWGFLAHYKRSRFDTSQRKWPLIWIRNLLQSQIWNHQRAKVMHSGQYIMQYPDFIQFFRAQENWWVFLAPFLENFSVILNFSLWKMHKNIIFLAAKIVKIYFDTTFFVDFFMSQKVGISPTVFWIDCVIQELLLVICMISMQHVKKSRRRLSPFLTSWDSKSTFLASIYFHF